MPRIAKSLSENGDRSRRGRMQSLILLAVLAATLAAAVLAAGR